MFCKFFNRTNLKTLLREQDTVPKDIKLKFLKRYTANCTKISELNARKKSSAVTKHVKFLKNSNNSELVKLYKYYRIATENERLKILGTLDKMDKYRHAINLSVTIAEISSTLK